MHLLAFDRLKIVSELVTTLHCCVALQEFSVSH